MQATNHYALIIGVANYTHMTPLGNAVERDVNAIQQLLVDENYCAYPQENVRTLWDADATAEAIRQSFVWLAESTDETSTVTLYFSGHGGHLGNGGPQQTYLLPVDARFVQSGLENAISGDEFSDLLRTVIARKVLVIFDCCHSGGIGQPKSASSAAFKRGIDPKYYQQLGEGQGRAIVASSLESETSVILFGDDNSLFTKHLLAGLRGGIPSTDGFVRVFELFSYIRQQVTEEAERNRVQQTPFFQCAVQDNFPVALYRAGKKEAYIEPAALPVPEDETTYDFDAYISCVVEPNDNDDALWVEDVLVPKLVDEGFKIAWALGSEFLGVSPLDDEAVGMTRAKRTLAVLSAESVQDHWSKVDSMKAQHMSIQEGNYRVIPVYRDKVDKHQVRLGLSMLSSVNLASRRAEREWQRLVQALRSPLPKM